MRYVSFALSAVLLSAVATQSAVADEFSDEIFTPRAGLYVSGTWGYTFDYTIESNDLNSSPEVAYFTLDEAQAFTGAIGMYLGQFRIEFEAGFRDADVLTSEPFSLGESVSGDIEYLSFMGNLFLDIPTPIQGLDVYLGGGAGIAIITGDFTFTPPTTVSDGFQSATTDFFGKTNTTFAYQFMAGITYNVTNNVAISGGYRIRLYSEFNDGESLLIFREHDVGAVEAGLRISF